MNIIVGCLYEFNSVAYISWSKNADTYIFRTYQHINSIPAYNLVVPKAHTEILDQFILKFKPEHIKSV